MHPAHSGTGLFEDFLRADPVDSCLSAHGIALRRAAADADPAYYLRSCPDRNASREDEHLWVAVSRQRRVWMRGDHPLHIGRRSRIITAVYALRRAELAVV